MIKTTSIMAIMVISLATIGSVYADNPTVSVSQLQYYAGETISISCDIPPQEGIIYPFITVNGVPEEGTTLEYIASNDSLGVHTVGCGFGGTNDSDPILSELVKFQINYVPDDFPIGLMHDTVKGVTYLTGIAPEETEPFLFYITGERQSKLLMITPDNDGVFIVELRDDNNFIDGNKYTYVSHHESKAFKGIMLFSSYDTTSPPIED